MDIKLKDDTQAIYSNAYRLNAKDRAYFNLIINKYREALTVKDT